MHNRFDGWRIGERIGCGHLSFGFHLSIERHLMEQVEIHDHIFGGNCEHDAQQPETNGPGKYPGGKAQ
jgi:hypothetical protein